MREPVPMGQTFWDLMRAAATEHPDRVVVADDYGRELTSVGLRDAAEVAAAGFHDEGVKPGDVVSWQLPTVLEAVVLLARAGPARRGAEPAHPAAPPPGGRPHHRPGRRRPDHRPRTLKGFDHAAMAGELGLEALVLDLDGDVPAGDAAARR